MAIRKDTLDSVVTAVAGNSPLHRRHGWTGSSSHPAHNHSPDQVAPRVPLGLAMPCASLAGREAAMTLLHAMAAIDVGHRAGEISSLL